MKVFHLLTMLCVSLTVFGQGNADAYSQKTEQEAIKFAYRILQVYYPYDNLCVSDSIYDHDWWMGSSWVDAQTKQELVSHRLKKRIYDPTIYSEYLNSLFGSEYDKCGKSKYVVDFSAPYKNMITCEVLPKDRKIGILGAPEIDVFLFRYNDKGEIYQVIKVIAHIE